MSPRPTFLLYTLIHKLTVSVLLRRRLHQLDKLHIDVNLHTQDQTHFQQHELQLADTWSAQKPHLYVRPLTGSGDGEGGETLVCTADD